MPATSTLAPAAATGAPAARNAQPVCIETQHGPLAVAHNGNLVNAVELREHRRFRIRLQTAVRDLQAHLVERLDPGNAALRAHLEAFAAALERAGASSAEAARQAWGVLYRQLAQQAQTLAYLDALFLLGCFTAVMVPLVFLTRPVQRGPAPAAH